jgi:plastocyanin
MRRTIGFGWLRGLGVLLVVAMATFAALGTSQPARAQDTSVSIVDFAFDPASITIEAGSTVTWTNNGATTHTVTSDDGAFDSGNLASGATYSFTFDTPGTYTYHCTIHPNMTATITVTEAGGTTATATATSGGTTATATTTTTTAPTTGAGTTAASRGVPTALLAVAIALALGGLLVARRRTAR